MSVVEATRNFFKKLKGFPEGEMALRRHNFTIQFKVGGEEPFYADIKDGEVLVEWGDITKERDRKDRCILEVLDSNVLKAIYEGKMRPVHAFHTDSLQITGIHSTKNRSMWVMNLLRLGQVGNYSDYLHQKYTKAWIRGQH